MLALALAVCLVFTPILSGEAPLNRQGVSVGAKAAIVMEAETGAVLFAQNIREQLPMASTTKIMTALLALESPELEEPFVVDPDAIRVEGSSMGLQEGDVVTLRDLAGGMLMASGNDAANAAAVRLAGTLPAFAEEMNRRAEAIGMRDTFFVTPSGLDAAGHCSTAYDMALLAREALQNEDFAQMAASKSLRLRYGNPPYDRTLSNHNRLLSLYPEAIGVKTGFTKSAGRCLVSAARRDGITLICVTLNCPDDWNVHELLYERSFPLVSRVELTWDLPKLPVTGGIVDQVPLRQTQQTQLPLAEGEAEGITAEIFAPEFLYAPVLEGDIVGKIVYYKDGSPVAQSPLAAAGECAARTVPSLSWWERLKSRLGWE